MRVTVPVVAITAACFCMWIGINDIRQGEAFEKHLDSIERNAIYHPQPSRESLRNQWYMTYTDAANDYSDQTLKCISEMLDRSFTTGLRPIDGGPECKKDCVLEAKVNGMADAAPSYIPDPQQYHLKGKASPWCVVRKVNKPASPSHHSSEM